MLPFFPLRISSGNRIHVQNDSVLARNQMMYKSTYKISKECPFHPTLHFLKEL